MFCVVNAINIYEFAIHITSGTKHDNKFIIFLFKVFFVLFSSLMFFLLILILRKNLQTLLNFVFS